MSMRSAAAIVLVLALVLVACGSASDGGDAARDLRQVDAGASMDAPRLDASSPDARRVPEDTAVPPGDAAAPPEDTADSSGDASAPEDAGAPAGDTASPQEDAPQPAADTPEPEDAGGPSGDAGEAVDPCGGLTLVGCCDDDVARWCEDGVVNAVACHDEPCGWDGVNGWYYCGHSGADPSGVWPKGCDAGE